MSLLLGLALAVDWSDFESPDASVVLRDLTIDDQTWLAHDGDRVWVSHSGGEDWHVLMDPDGALSGLQPSEDALRVDGVWLPEARGPKGATQMSRSATEPSRAYAVGEGVWSTRDGGASWDRLVEGKAFAVAVDPVDPDHVYVVRRGLEESRDGGRTWSTLVPMKGDAFSMLIWVEGELWVASAASVRVLRDGRLNPTGCKAVSVLDPLRLACALPGRLLVRDRESGGAEELHTGLLEPDVIGITEGPTLLLDEGSALRQEGDSWTSTRVDRTVEVADPEDPDRIFRVRGPEILRVQAGLEKVVGRVPGTRWLAFSPSGVLYAGGDHGLWWLDGARWEQEEEARVWDMEASRTALWAALGPDGLWTDQGPKQPPCLMVDSVALDDEGGRLVGCEVGGVFKLDGSWEQVDFYLSGHVTALDWLEGGVLAAGTSHTEFAARLGAGRWETNDPMDGARAERLVFSSDGLTGVVYGPAGLLRTTDGGQSWEDMGWRHGEPETVSIEAEGRVVHIWVTGEGWWRWQDGRWAVQSMPSIQDGDCAVRADPTSQGWLISYEGSFLLVESTEWGLRQWYSWDGEHWKMQGYRGCGVEKEGDTVTLTLGTLVRMIPTHRSAEWKDLAQAAGVSMRRSTALQARWAGLDPWAAYAIEDELVVLTRDLEIARMVDGDLVVVGVLPSGYLCLSVGPERIHAGTSRGIYVSEDWGATWTPLRGSR